jgi:hypothetical protein
MAGDASEEDDVSICFGTHVGQDLLDHVHGAKEVAFELVFYQGHGACGGRQFLHGAYDCFTSAAEEDVDLLKGMDGFCDRSLALTDDSRASQSLLRRKREIEIT